MRHERKNKPYCMRSAYEIYCTKCVECGYNTSKKYARAHEGKCSECVTGVSHRKTSICPQCGGHRSTFQAMQNYVCDKCCRENDPVGAYREVMGYND